MGIDAMKAVLDFLEQGNFVYPTKIADDLRAAITEAEQQEPDECQYAKDVSMPEYRCVGKCQYTAPQPAIPAGYALVPLALLKELEWCIHHYDPAHGHTNECPICAGAEPGGDIRYMSQKFGHSNNCLLGQAMLAAAQKSENSHD